MANPLIPAVPSTLPTGRAPTPEELAALANFATPPAPAPPPLAPGAGPVPGAPAALVADAGLPLPAPKVVAERPGDATDGAGTRYFTVQDGDGTQREVKSSPLGGSVPRSMLRDWNAQKRADEEAADAARKANDPATMTREQRATWEAGLSERQRLEYAASRGGAGAAKAKAELEALGPEVPASAPAAPARLKPEDFAVPPAAPATAGASPLATGNVQASATATAGMVPSFRPASAAPASGARALERGYEAAQKAAGERAAVEAQAAESDAARQEVELRAAEQRETQRLERETQRRQQVMAQEDKLRAALEETTKAAGEVNPDRWWNNRTTGQKVLAGVSSFMAGFGGGPDPIRAAIDRDIALQRESIQRAEGRADKGAKNQQTMLELMRQRFGDDIAAEKAAEIASLNLAQQRASLLAARSSSDVYKAKGQELVAQLEITKQEKSAELRLRFAQLAMNRDELDVRRASVRMEAMSQAAKMGAGDGNVRGATDPNTLTPEQRKRFVPGLGLALDDDAAKQVRKQTSNFQGLLSDLDKLIKFRAEYGSETIPTGKLAAARTLAKRVELGLKEDGALGALDNGSVEFLGQMTGGDIGSYGNIGPRLDALRGSIVDTYAVKVAPYMATPQQPESFTPAPRR